MRLRVYRSVKAVNGAANALFWKSSETQNFTRLTILKEQNTKTSLNKLSKNHWVITLFEIFGSVRKKLQFTVFNDHPVSQWQQCFQAEFTRSRILTSVQKSALIIEK